MFTYSTNTKTQENLVLDQQHKELSVVIETVNLYFAHCRSH